MALGQAMIKLLVLGILTFILLSFKESMQGFLMNLVKSRNLAECLMRLSKAVWHTTNGIAKAHSTSPEILNLAYDLGIVVSDEEVGKEIVNAKVYVDDKGEFSQEGVSPNFKRARYEPE